MLIIVQVSDAFLCTVSTIIDFNSVNVITYKHNLDEQYPFYVCKSMFHIEGASAFIIYFISNFQEFYRFCYQLKTKKLCATTISFLIFYTEK
jgi:hypothetical protein